MNHPTAFCPKCDQLQAIDQGTTLVKETILIDRVERDKDGARRLVKSQQLIAHTMAMLACRHHVTIVMPT